MLPFAQLAFARVLLRTTGVEARDAIENALKEVSRLARQMEMKTFEPFVCLERAELARLTGDEAARERELREAHRLFLEIGAPIRAPRSQGARVMKCARCGGQCSGALRTGNSTDRRWGTRWKR